MAYALCYRPLRHYLVQGFPRRKNQIYPIVRWEKLSNDEKPSDKQKTKPKLSDKVKLSQQINRLTSSNYKAVITVQRDKLSW